jgi:competence protein ComEC
MRYIAAIPAIALLAGAAVGLLVVHPPFVLASTLISASVAGAMFAYALRHPLLLAVSVSAGFFAGGVLLSFDAWQHAWRPSLRVRFEELARVERAHAESEGRRLPEDDEAFAVVEGVLRSDAAATESGVSLSIQVEGLEGEAERQEGGKVGRREGGKAGGPEGGKVGRQEGSERVTGGILVTVAGSLAAERMDDWRAGRRVRVPVTLRRPSRYLDPGVPDHERALARRGTTLVGTAKSGALVEILARGDLLDEAMGNARGFARRAIADAVGRWSAQSGAIVAAIVIGDRAGLDTDVQRALQEAGTYHVIAISGGNIAILAGLLLGAFRLAGWLGRTAMVASIAALLAYARFVGDGASVDRATLMAVVYFGAAAFDQRSPPLNALAVVAAVLVATDPLSIVDPAFVLTFGATLAILVVVPAVATTHVEQPETAIDHRVFAGLVHRLIVRIRRPFLSMFAASAAAEALLFPVAAIVFSRVTFAGLALNFLAIPLMAVAQIAGMAVVPTAIVSTRAAAAPGWIAHLGAAGLVRSADLLRFAPALSYRVAPPPWIAVVLYYGAALTWWTLWRRRLTLGSDADRAPPAPGVRRAVTSGAALIAAGAALWILVPPRMLAAAYGDGTLHVTFLDVGQGDSIFVIFPRGSTLLVDAGGLSFSSAFDIGDRVVAPVIRDAGFRRLDNVALTHGDPDHIGGAASIIREFRPREVWEGIPVPPFGPLTALRMAAQAAGARWANVYEGDRVVVDDVEVVARHPAPADWERQKVRNDDSIVLELRWRDVSVLLTGDIGKAVERVIGNTIPPASLRIVKIPHHGSLTSSATEFIAALQPRIAIVSAGRGNHFGHPAPEVLDRYRAIGAEIFRTDQDGAVMVDSDGYSVNVHTFTGRRLSIH